MSDFERQLKWIEKYGDPRHADMLDRIRAWGASEDQKKLVARIYADSNFKAPEGPTKMPENPAVTAAEIRQGMLDVENTQLANLLFQMLRMKNAEHRAKCFAQFKENATYLTKEYERGASREMLRSIKAELVIMVGEMIATAPKE